MAASVVVLTPNGRRQTVKVTPNTTILQILEEACIKHGFKPEEYDLKHHKKILDATSTIRFSGLPNNAMLELTAATVLRTEREVILGLQMEDGDRLMGNFLPSSNLFEILTTLCPTELLPGKNPVVIYMRQEIYGYEALQSTSLKSLGLTGGRAMLRLLQRSPDELKTQANVSAPLPVKPVEEKPYVRQFQRVPSPVKTHPPVSRAPISPPPKKDDGSDESMRSSEPTAQKAQQILKKPQVQQVNRSNQNVTNVIKQEKRKQTDGIKTKNVPTNQNASTGTKPPQASSEDFVFLGARNAMLFSLETAQSVRSDDLPDDFFELSISDVKKLFKDIKKRRLDMDNNPLKTEAMRKLEESKRQLRQLNQYKKTIIRIQFPSRLVLQGIFSPTETVNHVMLFVKEYLENKNLNFYLFTAPPKNILVNTVTLLEAHCVPGALLYFGSDIKHDTYLKKDILSKITSTSLATMAATKLREQSKRSVNDKSDDEDMEVDETNNVNVGASTSAAPTTYDDYEKKENIQTTAPDKVPKWFKPTKSYRMSSCSIKL